MAAPGGDGLLRAGKRDQRELLRRSGLVAARLGPALFRRRTQALGRRPVADRREVKLQQPRAVHRLFARSRSSQQQDFGRELVSEAGSGYLSGLRPALQESIGVWLGEGGTIEQPNLHSAVIAGIVVLLPGLLMTIALSPAAIFIGKLSSGSGASPLMIGVLLGVIVRLVVGAPAKMRPGVEFVQKHLLRIAIVLLGAQLTFEKVGAVGGAVLLVIIAAVVLTFAFTWWAGRWLRTDPALAQLIAAGSSICGISAIVASNTVVKAPDEDVAYAIATATAFGSLSIFIYPVVAAGLSLNPMLYAVWVGSSLHEVAQVIAAGFIYGEEAGEFAVVVKLTRVLMLVPMVLMLGWITGLRHRSSSGAGRSLLDVLRDLPLPIFIAGF